MIDEIELFIKDIKPTILISKNKYNNNIELLKNYKLKVINNDSFLIYKKEEDIVNKKLGECLGYPPICVKEFEYNQKKEKKDVIISKFLNYGGINFNCFDYYEEALEWCNKNYKQKMLSSFGKIEIIYTEAEFVKNYLNGYERNIKNKKTFEISK